VGIGAKGNEGVAGNVAQTKGSIGYVEYAYAKENKMTFTKMINKAGKVVAPGSDTVQAAAASADWSSKPGFGVILANQPGDQSWPMAAATWILMYKKPEKPRRFPWHQDNGYAFVEPQQYLTCWVALTDATVDNGCPQVIPGLHRNGTYQHRYVDPLGWEIIETHPDAVAAPVGTGGIVVFSSLTPHLTGPNTTDAVRKAYILQYAPAGAAVLTGDSTHGAPTGRVPADAPGRQFAILRGGEPVVA